jgi:hypothetical protein
MEQSRRDFVERMGIGTLMLGTAPLALDGSVHEGAWPTPVAPVEEFDMSWTTRVVGKHKAILDVPEIESGYGVWRAGITRKQLLDMMKVTARDVSMVLVLRHNGIHLAMNQAFWDAFGVGKANKVTHPADGKPTDRNPALLDAKGGLPRQFDGLSVPQFIAGGGIVLACDLALNLVVVPMFKTRDKSTDAAARATAIKAIIPGVVLQPSGVFAAIRAQEVGCVYVRAS